VVAIAFNFGRREVGVDIEKIDLTFDYWEIAGHYFSEKECAQLFSHRDFYRFWTMKEALLKVTGVGLVDDLPGLDLSETVNRVQVKDERLLPFKNEAFTLYTFDNEEIVLTLAVSGNHFSELQLRHANATPFAIRHVHFCG
jgi:4'-phosphopantetheinyl transferase